MRLFVTEIKAICPITGDLLTYAGQLVPGICLEDAQRYCNENGLGYCKVVGEFVCEVDNDGIRYDFGNN